MSGGRVVLLLAVTVALFVVILIGAMIVSFLAQGPGATEDPTSGTTFVLLMAAQPIVFIGVGYLLAIRLWGLDWRDFGFVAMKWRWVGLVPLIWLLFLPVIRVLKWISDFLLGTPGSNPYADTFEALGPVTPGLVITIIILGGVLVPISEEFLFRGLLYPWLKSRWGFLTGLIGSSILFSLLHLHPAILAPILALGIMMALLREWSESLWAPILFHSIHNTAMFTIMFGLLAAGEDIRAI
ncbi:MAG: CPBP family intramembrane metalloprotease [Alphaproteobacteria bacterium]|nr:CPBP family intramembrane metalloprotease [Alphaproteobacteria bacterium]